MFEHISLITGVKIGDISIDIYTYTNMYIVERRMIEFKILARSFHFFNQTESVNWFQNKQKKDVILAPKKVSKITRKLMQFSIHEDINC